MLLAIAKRMSKSTLIDSCEVSINFAINRLSILEGKNKKALENEFREWMDAIESDNKNYDVLFVNKIN